MQSGLGGAQSSCRCTASKPYSWPEHPWAETRSSPLSLAACYWGSALPPQGLTLQAKVGCHHGNSSCLTT